MTGTGMQIIRTNFLFADDGHHSIVRIGKRYCLGLKNNIMTTGKAVLAVLAAVAAGAVIGMLFAPDKGSETRKKIVKKGEDVLDTIEDKVEKKFSEAKEKFSFNYKKPKVEEPVNSSTTV
jgi:hypothetical protein